MARCDLCKNEIPSDATADDRSFHNNGQCLRMGF
jgi:hypothetical protein